MGEITIQVPTKTRRRYLVEDRKLADQILSALELSAIRIQKSRLSAAEREDAADAQNVKKALTEFAKTGKVRPLAELKTELGL
ncbi:MAG: hypothetical protein WKF34_01260 [Pyrinomonadaceae bacterium]